MFQAQEPFSQPDERRKKRKMRPDFGASVVSPSARKSAGFAFSARNVKDRKIDVATFVFSGI